jgi:hypothetical protein
MKHSYSLPAPDGSRGRLLRRPTFLGDMMKKNPIFRIAPILIADGIRRSWAEQLFWCKAGRAMRGAAG